MGLVGLRPQNFMLSHFIPSSPPSLLAIFCSFPLKPYHPRRLCGCDDMTKIPGLQTLRPNSLSSLAGSLNHLMLSNNELLEVFLPSSHFICQKCFQTTSSSRFFYHPHICQDFHFLNQVPTIAFRQLRELDHVNLNQVIKTSSFLNLYYSGTT